MVLFKLLQAALSTIGNYQLLGAAVGSALLYENSSSNQTSSHPSIQNASNKTSKYPQDSSRSILSRPLSAKMTPMDMRAHRWLFLA
jgi:hypothetical protein